MWGLSVATLSVSIQATDRHYPGFRSRYVTPFTCALNTPIFKVIIQQYMNLATATTDLSELNGVSFSGHLGYTLQGVGFDIEQFVLLRDDTGISVMFLALTMQIIFGNTV
jgi:hypothetical protein